MKKMPIRSVMFISYTFILAILVTSYMGPNTYLMNFYILPILFGAYYFDIFGALIITLLSIALSMFYMKRTIDLLGEAPEITHIAIIFTQAVTFTVVGIISGIFQRENNKLNQYLLKASLTDKLTELYNYGYFTKRITEEISRADRYNHPVALIMLDIDHFKDYNDTYGHLNGNQALIKFAKIITESIRSSDIAFRYGGEEFTVILPETGEGALEMAERLRQKIENEVFPGNVHLSVSSGVTYYPYSKSFPVNIVEQADKALYEAKEGGRNRVCMFRGK